MVGRSRSKVYLLSSYNKSLCTQKEQWQVTTVTLADSPSLQEFGKTTRQWHREGGRVARVSSQITFRRLTRLRTKQAPLTHSVNPVAGHIAPHYLFVGVVLPKDIKIRSRNFLSVPPQHV